MNNTDIARMAGRTVAVTGATDGLGRELALRLGAAGARVIVHGRDTGRAEAVAAQIRAAGGPEPRVVLADLASLAEVDRLAAAIAAATDRLDVLVNNAAVGFGRPGAPRELSADGYELRWAVNHLAPYRLTRRLLPLLRASAPARVVNVASAGQVPIDFDDLALEHGYDGVRAYRRSKVAMIMSTFDLAQELAGTGVTVNALHPAGFMATTMVIESATQPLSTVAEGAAATLRLIYDTDVEGLTGRYFNGLQAAQPHPQILDPEARRRLRQATDAAAAVS